MEKLIKLSEKKTAAAETGFIRYLYHEIDWNQRLIVILGHRGSGKTTLLLQKMKQVDKKAIYISLDDIYFEANRLVTLIDDLYEEGYRKIFLDEAHRYDHWSKDLKNVYDNYPDIQMVVTGSSILEIARGREDLSRRAVVYHLSGLSFREYLMLQHNIKSEVLKLSDILDSHVELAEELISKGDMRKLFREYLRYGYYPFFREGIRTYPQKLRESTNLVLDLDVAPYEELNYSTLRSMKKLMYVISQSVPFKPNISRLSQKLGVPRNTILKMLDLLDRANILALLRTDSKGLSYLQKPDKIYLQNTNLLFIYSENTPTKGNVRETFFLNQLRVRHRVISSRYADFMVDDVYTFEIGGPSKTREQIRGVPNAWIAADEIEEGSGDKIPLWLFGFLY